MGLFLDSFWRAVAYCLHPRVIFLSILPVVLIGGLAFGLGWFFWEPAVAAVSQQLHAWSLVESFLAWLDSVGGAGLRGVLAPMIVVALAVPAIVVTVLMAVALLMMPAMVNLVAARRFPGLERRHGSPWWIGLLWGTASLIAALLALAASVPFWLVPPLVLILPPLIWGWLTYRVMAFDALADHADGDERRRIMQEHRWPLLAIGVLTGYLGAAPSLVWAVGAVALVLAPLLMVVSVWLYTLVFAFSALWFTHYGLAALQRLRAAREGELLAADAVIPPTRPVDAEPGLDAPARPQTLPDASPGASAGTPPLLP